MPVRTERHDHACVITIDRPQVRNAVDGPTARDLEAAVDAAEADDAVRVLVLTGADGTFCAGADLKALASGDASRLLRLQRTLDGPLGPTRRAPTKPVIAAIEGHAVAGGFELALWADLRVVAEDAHFGFLERRWGVPLIDGGTVRLARMVGVSRASDLVLTGRTIGASEAAEMGIANRVCAPGTALEMALLLAAELAAFPQACMRADLAGVRAAHDGQIDEMLLLEHDRGVASLETGEMLEGLAAFVGGAGRGGRAR
ncbi:MAG: crotonase/enoyl-CoA hydratase family protein [Nitriliruptorales bacterium]|nr:crotonase/enoyl-CoA hydratase family protein [Nitriliruptorales bacterium]